MLGGDADDLRHFEIAPAQLDLDLAHELRLALDGLQHLGEAEASLAEAGKAQTTQRPSQGQHPGAE